MQDRTLIFRFWSSKEAGNGFSPRCWSSLLASIVPSVRNHARDFSFWWCGTSRKTRFPNGTPCHQFLSAWRNARRVRKYTRCEGIGGHAENHRSRCPEIGWTGQQTIKCRVKSSAALTPLMTSGITAGGCMPLYRIKNKALKTSWVSLRKMNRSRCSGRKNDSK